MNDVAWLAAEVELRRSDLASGNVPDDVTRPLFPHEVDAGTNFADIQDAVDSTSGIVHRQLIADRASFIGLLETDLAAVAANPGAGASEVAVAQRLMALNSTLGIDAIAGVGALIAQSEARYHKTLSAATSDGAGRALQEAFRQGVKTPPQDVPLDGDTDARISLGAQRLATAPHADVLSDAADLAYQIPDPAEVVSSLKQLSPNVLANTYARPAVQQAETMGRIAAMSALPVPADVYASALLDKVTCGPCRDNDGHQYTSLAAGKLDYPSGGYRKCLGTDRCRCTLVSVYGEMPSSH